MAQRSDCWMAVTIMSRYGPLRRAFVNTSIGIEAELVRKADLAMNPPSTGWYQLRNCRGLL
jgi:hypothetical protein